MTGKSWKEGLREAFEAPSPLEKEEFLRRLDRPRISTVEFVLTQAAYVNRRSRLISVLVYGVAVAGAMVLDLDMVWAISALTPLLALALVSECRRSERYGMEELEMTTRFSLRSVILARLGILGAENLAALCLLVPVGACNSRMGMVQAGLYIAVPFLLTAFLALWVEQRLRGQEGGYVSAGIAVCISLGAYFFHREMPVLYQESYVGWWMAGALVLGIGILRQYGRMIKRTEELS